MVTPPYVIGGAMMMYGYLKSMATQKERYGDLAFRQFLRGYQRNCLFRGKQKATEVLNQKQAEIWARRHVQSASSLPKAQVTSA